MPSRTRRNCTCCGKHDSEVGPISWGGNCRTCGKLIVNENMDGISAGEGPAHRRRLRGYVRWLEREANAQQQTS